MCVCVCVCKHFTRASHLILNKTIILFQLSKQAHLMILHTELYLYATIPPSRAFMGDQIANISWIIKKAREFQEKHLLLLY